MAKQNNSLTELQALEGIYEHLSTIDNLSEEVGKISTRLSKIEQTHNTTLTTMTAFTELMTQSFEEMKNTKLTEVPVSLCKTEAVKTIVREQVKEVLKELKAIGNNLNQLVTLAHMGKVTVINLSEVRQLLADIRTAVRETAERKRW